MSVQFPLAIKEWSPTESGFNYPVDLKEIVYARHVTTIYGEVTAIERELGAGGLRDSVTYTSMYDATPGRRWANLKSRLENIEQGAHDGALRRVSTGGGSTVLPSGTSVVGLTIRAAAGQTANLFETRNSSNVIRTTIGSDGLIAGVIDGGNA
jgi:hypothetical protein